MKKINIVSEKNENTNAYEIKTIVIFEDNKTPKIINYEGIQDLLSIVKVAEENGFDILGSDGIRPAINAGLIEIVSRSNEKAMSLLKTQILSEQLKYGEEKEEKEEIANTEVNKRKVYKAVGRVKYNLPKSKEEIAEYFKLNNKRSNNDISIEDAERIDELARSNKKIGELELARKEMIAAMDKATVSGLVADESELEEKKNTYRKLFEECRRDLSNSIKDTKTVETVKNENTELTQVYDNSDKEVTSYENNLVNNSIISSSNDVFKSEVPTSEEEKNSHRRRPVSVQEVVPETVPVETVNEEPKRRRRTTYTLKEVEKDPEVKDFNVTEDEKVTMEYTNLDGEKETVEVKTTSKWHEFAKSAGAFVMTMVVGLGAITGVSALVKHFKNQHTLKPIGQSVEISRVTPLPISNIGMANAAVGVPSAVTKAPTVAPTATPVVTKAPTVAPTATPVVTKAPTVAPTATPVVTKAPTVAPTATPVVTKAPTVAPTATPVVTKAPTVAPTATPVVTK
ncbi:MAG: hypothetical protein IJ568_06825, partial [Bacilli bacterium]|nr:hypothetical protein [Bacilli bacterium]